MITSITLTDFGNCKVTNENREFRPNTPTDYFLSGDQILFINQTDSIRVEKGLRFGIQYVLDGIEEENAEEFVCCIIHPSLTHPTTNELYTKVTEVKVGCIGESNFDYFYFEYDWEMQPGSWLFQVCQSDKLLLEKAFNLFI